MFFIVLWVIMAIIVAMIAKSKGRDALLWGLYGFAIWPIALVHILLAKDEV